MIIGHNKQTTYPEETKKDGRAEVVLVEETGEKDGKEEGVAEAFLGILGIATVIVTLGLDAFMEGLEATGNVVLSGRVEGGILANVGGDFLLDEEGDVGFGGDGEDGGETTTSCFIVNGKVGGGGGGSRRGGRDGGEIRLVVEHVNARVAGIVGAGVEGGSLVVRGGGIFLGLRVWFVADVDGDGWLMLRAEDPAADGRGEVGKGIGGGDVTDLKGVHATDGVGEVVSERS